MPFSRAYCFLALPALVGLAALTGCSLQSSLGLGSGLLSSGAPQTSGMAVADEPFAAKTATDIMAQGGSAADAVTAMFFAMSVTYPVSVGLGGGGICILAEPRGAGTHEFDFLARDAKAGGAFGVPGAVRGFHDLQSAYGTLPWQRDVSPAEAFAATGFPISHALAQRLVAAQNIIRLDAPLAAEFLDESGKPLAEGVVVKNSALSQTLATIRLSGADGFYQGAVAAAIADYAGTAGGALTLADLSDYRGSETAAHIVNEGDLSVALPGSQTGAGAYMAALLNNLPPSADPEAQVAAAERQSLTRFGVASLPQDFGATGFVAVDAKGEAAACAMTMNGPFGAGHTVPGTGVTLASPPAGTLGLSTAFLAPMVARDGSGNVVMAGAGAGGPNGTAAAVYALLKLAAGQALGRRADLRSTGVAPFATINVISCNSGYCVPLADPGGHGLGAATP